MLSAFDRLRTVSMASITVRLLLATLCGGLIGLERAYKRRPAGFRTHILICLGAAVTTLTSQFLFLNMHYYTDIARLGAQVIAGIGFIGAGTIIITGRQHVQGLTTAAGLWVAAIIGLAFGSGFYEGGLCATALVMVAELIFSRLEFWLLGNVHEIRLYIEFESIVCFSNVVQIFRSHQLAIMDIEMIRADGDGRQACAIITLSLNRSSRLEELLQLVRSVDGVISIESL